MVNTTYSKYRLLIVDDHRTMLQALQSLVLQIGFFNVDTAVDGVDALEKINANHYDLIISDWNMPNMDGIELLRRIRSSTELKIKALPVILVTAESKVENILLAKKTGVNNYIVKPLSLATLKQKIDITLGIF